MGTAPDARDPAVKGPSRRAGRSGWAGVGRWGALSRKCPRCGAAIGWRCFWMKGDQQQVFKAEPCPERRTKVKSRVCVDQVILPGGTAVCPRHVNGCLR